MLRGFSLWDLVEHHIFVVQNLSIQSVMKRHEKSFVHIISKQHCDTLSFHSNSYTIKLQSWGKEEIFSPFLSQNINLLFHGLSYISTSTMWVTFRLHLILSNLFDKLCWAQGPFLHGGQRVSLPLLTPHSSDPLLSLHHCVALAQASTKPDTTVRWN